MSGFILKCTLDTLKYQRMNKITALIITLTVAWYFCNGTGSKTYPAAQWLVFIACRQKFPAGRPAA